VGRVGAQEGESEKQRIDRELGEMLEEIRVALPGTQLLLGFLLILPFSNGFTEIQSPARAMYLISFVLTGAAIALLVAPTAEHRLGFRKVDKLALMHRTNRQIIAALALMAVSLSLAVYVVCSKILASWAAALIAAALALWFALWWLVMPRLVRHRSLSAAHAS
jgi:hypothetical protein